MTSSSIPGLVAPRGLERGLIWTIAVSAAAHVGLLVVLLTVPGHFLTVPRGLESYSVDLVAPEVVGGTNLVVGTAPKPAPPPPAPVAVEAPAPKPPAPAEPAPAAEPKPPPVEPIKEAPLAKAPEPPPPPAKPAEPKVAEPKVVAPKVVAPKVVAPKVVEPKAVQPVPEVVAKKAEPPPPAPKPAQAVEAKPAAAEKPAAKPAAVEKPLPAKPDRVPAAAKPATDAKPAKPAKPELQAAGATKQEQAIAAAVQRRAEQVKGAAANAGSAADQRIAAAVQRRAAQVEAAKETAAAGAVVGAGPGTDAGGTPADLQYILYQGKMNERVKAAWAWAGANRTLHAVVQFNITPEGEVRNVRTIESSGDATFDASAERAVRAVNPLDPVPEKHRALFATVTMTFRASDLES